MPIVQLPDGKELTYKNSVTGLEIAKDISISLSKKALALQIDGEYKDLDTEIVKDSKIKIITLEDEYALELLRHDAAHVCAMAVQ